MSEPTVTFVVVEYRTPELLTALLSTWRSWVPDGESGQMVIVRNALATGFVSNDPDVVLLENRENLGFARAFNQGLAVAQGWAVISLNLDVDCDRLAVAALLEALRHQPASLVAPRLYNASRVGGLRSFYSPWSLVAARTPLRDRYIWTRSDEEPGWALGACLAAARETWQLLKGYDDGFFLYFEDVDLSWRAWEMGVPVRLAPTEVFHAHARHSRSSIRILSWHMRSASRFFRKHPRSLLGLGPRFAQVHSRA